MHRFRWRTQSKWPSKPLWLMMQWEGESPNPTENDKMLAFVCVITNTQNEVIKEFRVEGTNFTQVASKPGAAYPKGLVYDPIASMRAYQLGADFCRQYQES